MASGVRVNPQCLDVFQSLKLKKDAKYIIFELNHDNTEIVVAKTSTSSDYDDFIADLPKDKPLFAVYDFEFEKEDGGKRNKIIFVSWSPDDAMIKHKMVYASSKEAFRRTLTGVSIEIQGTDYDEISHETVLDKANRGH